VPWFGEPVWVVDPVVVVPPPAAAADAVALEESPDVEPSLVPLVPLVLVPEPEPELEDVSVEASNVDSSSEVSVSCADFRVVSSSSSVRLAEEGSSVAISCPFLTCSPTLTSMLFRVPLVWKLTSSSTPGSTFPLPETVLWTTPSAAVTSSVDVRAELVVVPIWVMEKTITAIATAASRAMYHGLTDRRLRVRFMEPNLRIYS
jgi:hypothetical protein